MQKGDLVLFRHDKNIHSPIPECIGLVIEVQTRGPVPGAYVLWPNEDKTEWIKIESLTNVSMVTSR